MDFHTIDIKTGKISEKVVFTADDEKLKQLGMNVNKQSKNEKSE